jgi:fluoride exporter
MALLVAIGAAIGAPARYLTDRWVQARFGAVFPFGTLTVNVVGSLTLGLLTGLAAGKPMLALLGTGLCGAMTTYSTFGYETVQLLAERAVGLAILNVATNVLAGLAAVTVGITTATTLT